MLLAAFHAPCTNPIGAGFNPALWSSSEADFLQDIIGVYQPTSGDVGLRCIKSAVQGFAIVVIEPVAEIQGHPIDLGPFSMRPGGARGRSDLEALVERSHEAALDYAPATAKGYSSAH